MYVGIVAIGLPVLAEIVMTLRILENIEKYFICSLCAINMFKTSTITKIEEIKHKIDEKNISKTTDEKFKNLIENIQIIPIGRKLVIHPISILKIVLQEAIKVLNDSFCRPFKNPAALPTRAENKITCKISAP